MEWSGDELCRASTSSGYRDYTRCCARRKKVVAECLRRKVKKRDDENTSKTVMKTMQKIRVILANYLESKPAATRRRARYSGRRSSMRICWERSQIRDRRTRPWEKIQYDDTFQASNRLRTAHLAENCQVGRMPVCSARLFCRGRSHWSYI